MPVAPLSVHHLVNSGDRAGEGGNGWSRVCRQPGLEAVSVGWSGPFWRLLGRACDGRGASVGIAIWQAIWLHVVGMPILGQDVSGTGWQTLGRAMQSITTMMPVWQCGHVRNDCPVSASKRSR